MRGEAEPRDLLDAAEGFLDRADPATAGLWPRAAAILALQALEKDLLRLWERRALALRDMSLRAQLICLRTYLGDARLASRVGHASAALSRACHHHPYELAPTAGELRTWLEAVRDLVESAEP